MTVEIVVGIVAVVLALVGGGAAWVRADQHGRTSNELERTKEDLAHAEQRADAASAPPAKPAEASAILRARLARLERRLRRTREGRE